MDRTKLVGVDVEGGARLLTALDDAGFDPVAAFWLYRTESETWRLMLASKYVDRYGPRKAYSLVDDVIERLQPKPGFTLMDVSVVSPRHQIVRLLRKAVKTEDDISGIRLTRSGVNGTYIEDAYIYRTR